MAAPTWIPPNTFASRLVLLRRELGLSIEAIAEKVGVDDGSWSNWERGTSPRNQAEVVAKIAKATGVNRDWLLWGYTQEGDALTGWRTRRAGSSGPFLGRAA